MVTIIICVIIEVLFWVIFLFQGNATMWFARLPLTPSTANGLVLLGYRPFLLGFNISTILLVCCNNNSVMIQVFCIIIKMLIWNTKN